MTDARAARDDRVVTEVEIKVAIESVTKFQEALDGMGAELVEPRHFEDNVLFDTPDRRLTSDRKLLRVRVVHGRGVLTAKAPKPDADPRYKVREEVETEIEDPQAVMAVLEAAGFQAIWRYQKYRSTFRWNDAHIVLDETPIGVFAEIEATPEVIEQALQVLDLSSVETSTQSYRTLHELHCAERGVPVGDLLFPETRS